MESTTKWLGELSRLVRESTVKRLRQVQSADRFWSPRPDILTFADILQHLIDADRWLLACLEDREYPEAKIAPHDADGSEWDTMLAELHELGEQRTQRVAALSADQLAGGTVEISGSGVTIPPWYLVLRRGIDHEIHHRGELQMLLRLRYGG